MRSKEHQADVKRLNKAWAKDHDEQAAQIERLREAIRVELARVPHGRRGLCPGSYSMGGGAHVRGDHEPGVLQNHPNYPCLDCEHFNKLGSLLSETGGTDDGPGDMVCKAHDVPGCAECWEAELSDTGDADDE